MTKSLVLGIILYVFTSASVTLAEQPQTTLPLCLALELVDGSRIIGVPSINSVSAQTSYATVDIPLKTILSIMIDDDPEHATIELVNGDKLTAVLNLDPLELATIFGTASIGIEHIRALDVLLTGPATPDELKRGLVLQYSFDKDEDGKTTDLSDMNNHGTVSGARWTPNGKNGGAYEFDGTDDYMETIRALPDMESASFSAWLFISALESTERYIFMEGDTTGGSDMMLCLQSENHGLFRTKDNNDLIIPGSQVPVRQWFHIAAIADRENKRKQVWINGTNVNDITWHGTANVGHHFNLNIGCWGDGSGRRHFFKGKMDELRFFNRALSAGEIRQIYTSQK